MFFPDTCLQELLSTQAASDIDIGLSGADAALYAPIALGLPPDSPNSGLYYDIPFFSRHC